MGDHKHIPFFESNVMIIRLLPGTMTVCLAEEVPVMT